jgi:hypothetical protein
LTQPASHTGRSQAFLVLYLSFLVSRPTALILAGGQKLITVDGDMKVVMSTYVYLGPDSFVNCESLEDTRLLHSSKSQVRSILCEYENLP